MLDYKIITFIKLAKILNYTKTAKALHLTQPAVTMHIKALESQYNIKLFDYQNKKLTLTKQGKLLYEHSLQLYNKSVHLENKLKNTNYNHLNFATTLTIGNYTLKNIIKEIVKQNRDLKISMLVDNTENLFKKLDAGLVDFLIIEGHFDKEKYSFYPFKKADFIGVCSIDNPLAKQNNNLNQLLEENLIIREKGSGSRDILEHSLYDHNFKINSFKSVNEFSNISIIIDLVKENLGISFLYKDCVVEELLNKQIAKINILEIDIKREFNFVYLKDSLFKDKYLEYFNYIIELSK